MGDGEDSDPPPSQWLRLLPSFLLKSFMAEQNLQSWFLGDLSLPSPQIASILIKSKFPFYQQLPLSRVLIFQRWVARPEFVTTGVLSFGKMELFWLTNQLKKNCNSFKNISDPNSIPNFYLCFSSNHFYFKSLFLNILIAGTSFISLPQSFLLCFSFTDQINLNVVFWNMWLLCFYFIKLILN